MTRLLDPRPMSPAEVADLVERVRANEAKARRSSVQWQLRDRGGAMDPGRSEGVVTDERRRGPVSRRELDARHADRVAARRQRLDQARALRVLEFPAGAFCALCAEPCVGALHREPLGRGGAMVNVCVSCATEPAREREHLFGGSARGGIGEGNRWVGARGLGNR